MSNGNRSNGGGGLGGNLLLIGIILLALWLAFPSEIGGIANQVGTVVKNFEFSFAKAEANPQITVNPNIVVQQDPSVGQALRDLTTTMQQLQQQNQTLQGQVQQLQVAVPTSAPTVKSTPYVPMVLKPMPTTPVDDRNPLEKLRDINPFIPHGWFGKP